MAGIIIAFKDLFLLLFLWTLFPIPLIFIMYLGKTEGTYDYPHFKEEEIEN